VLVRHGEAAAGWDADIDPGLSPLGVEQAAANAAALASEPARPLLTSPLRRARETAAPLAEAWGVAVRVEPAIGEIPSPTSDLAERGAWLSRFMAGTWDEAGPELLSWRAHLLDALNNQAAATVMFTHFIAINVAVGEANGDRRVVCFLPDNASRTVLDASDGRLTVVELGAQARTAVR
jgi:broad specificity phosphatase PhoE